MIKWLKQKWKSFNCNHQYEILSEYQKYDQDPYLVGWESFYKLYCPYCDDVHSVEKSEHDEKMGLESERMEFEKKKAEIKKRVLEESE